MASMFDNIDINNSDVEISEVKLSKSAAWKNINFLEDEERSRRVEDGDDATSRKANGLIISEAIRGNAVTIKARLVQRRPLLNKAKHFIAEAPSAASDMFKSAPAVAANYAHSLQGAVAPAAEKASAALHQAYGSARSAVPSAQETKASLSSALDSARGAAAHAADATKGAALHAADAAKVAAVYAADATKGAALHAADVTKGAAAQAADATKGAALHAADVAKVAAAHAADVTKGAAAHAADVARSAALHTADATKGAALHAADAAKGAAAHAADAAAPVADKTSSALSNAVQALLVRANSFKESANSFKDSLLAKLPSFSESSFTLAQSRALEEAERQRRISEDRDSFARSNAKRISQLIEYSAKGSFKIHSNKGFSKFVSRVEESERKRRISNVRECEQRRFNASKISKELLQGGLNGKAKFAGIKSIKKDYGFEHKFARVLEEKERRSRIKNKLAAEANARKEAKLIADIGGPFFHPRSAALEEKKAAPIETPFSPSAVRAQF